MVSKGQENVEKLKKSGSLPSATKGKQRWKITYSNGKEEILGSTKTVNKVVDRNNNGIVKIEKKKVIVKLIGETKKDFIEKDITDWRDVSSYYL